MRNALIVRRLLYRAILFIPAASAVWALLPVVAAGNLGLGSAGYGLLLGMVGIGAVAGAFVIPRLRARIGSARLVTGAMVVTRGGARRDRREQQPGGGGRRAAAGRGRLDRGDVQPQLRPAAGRCRTGCGPAGWPTTSSSSRVRRRSAAVIWGVVADATSVTVALLVAAAVLAVGAVVGLRTPMPDTTKLDRTPSTHWPAPQLIFTPDAADGPVLVTRDLPRAGGQRGRVHRGDGPRRPLPQAHGRPALGAVPRRRRSHPVRRVLPRRHLGRASAAAREQAHRRRPPVRGAGPPLHASASREVAHLFPP